MLTTLCVIFIASWATFWMLTHRWTSHRRRVALIDWGRGAGFRLQACGIADLPPPLRLLSDRHPVVEFCLSGRGMKLMQIKGKVPPRREGMPAGPREAVWNVAATQLDHPWQPTGARPSSAPLSILDQFSLSSFPLLGGTERFTVFGTDSEAAAVLARSMARSLLPPDVGLLLHGQWLLLDFSGRPFDELELDRMVALARQLASKLPAPAPIGRPSGA